MLNELYDDGLSDRANADRDFADQLEIGDILHAQARAVDRQDEGLLSGLWTAGAPFCGAGPDASDMAAAPSSLHMLGNSLFQKLGDNIFVETYHLDYETRATPAGLEDVQTGGRYLDIFRKDGARWLLHSREEVVDWRHVAPVTEAFHELTAAGSLLGTRGPADPLYAFSPDVFGQLPPVDAPGSSAAAPNPLSIDQLSARHAICGVIYRHARAMDRGDPNLAADCFPESPAVTTAPTATATFHFISNILVHFKDENTAFSEAYHLIHRQEPNGTLRATGGRYLDRFERHGARWAVAQRETVEDWSRVLTGLDQGGYGGESNARDPLYQYIGRGPEGERS